MIEFLLLFALGFLTAAITGLLLAPVVHRRIVRFAEDRLKATMPLSPQEVRAQKDMARAFYAAKTARAVHEMNSERDKRTALARRIEDVTGEARRLVSENSDLHSQIADMNVEAADMRSTARQIEQRLDRLRSTLTAVEKDDIAKSGEIETLVQRMDRTLSDLDSMKIDLATRETEIENLKSRMNAVREERDQLRKEGNSAIERSREFEMRLTRSENRVRNLEARVAKQTAVLADKETTLERRLSEINRLKLRIKSANADARQAQRALLAAGLELPPKTSGGDDEDGASRTMEETPMAFPALDISELDDDVRNQANALSERLTKTKSPAQDDALREELADLASKMVALTVLREGPGSPVIGLLKQSSESRSGRKNLAARASSLLTPEEPA